MESTLKVKNFGPIKDATLNMRNVNVLIGPQASGKSTLAKLYTICKSPSCYNEFEINNIEKIKLSKERFIENLRHYAIFDFLSEDSVIEFSSPTHDFRYIEGEIQYKNKLNDYHLNIEDSNDVFTENLGKLFKQSINFLADITFDLFLNKKRQSKKFSFKNFNNFLSEFDWNELSRDDKKSIIDQFDVFKAEIFLNDALYVPAERTILNLLKQAPFSFQNLKIPIPQHLLSYGYKYEIAANEIGELDLSFIHPHSKYKFQDNIDKIYFSSNKSVKLTESASSFQSIVPILLPILNEREDENKQYSFVIEEPETNLYPKAQYDLIKFLEKDREDDLGWIDKGGIHTYTTHSPFILTALNNMLYAFKKGNEANESVKNKISNIIDQKNWISPDNFSAYEIKNGKSKSIFDRKTGLIKENSIDVISEEIIEDFRNIALASIE